MRQSTLFTPHHSKGIIANQIIRENHQRITRKSPENSNKPSRFLTRPQRVPPMLSHLARVTAYNRCGLFKLSIADCSSNFVDRLSRSSVTHSFATARPNSHSNCAYITRKSKRYLSSSSISSSPSSSSDRNSSDCKMTTTPKCPNIDVIERGARHTENYRVYYG